ncbi:MAG TPA: stage II sporulation protein E [Bacillota bacterium]|nr:stage II sporulation protein E [Bacillota bacterium]
MSEMMSKVNETNFSVHHQSKESMMRHLFGQVVRFFMHKNVLLFIVGVLLGRAVILTTVSPFALGFLASVWVGYRNKSLIVIFAMLIGAFTYNFMHGVFISLALVVFIIFVAIFKRHERQRQFLPLFVSLSTMIPRMFLFSLDGQLTNYEWLFLMVEGVLGAVLVLIFMQSLPLLSKDSYRSTLSLKHEEVVSLLILVASIFTGMVGWSIYGVAIEQIFARFFVLSVAFVGGATIGSTVGVITGFILSLALMTNVYEVSLLAFSGLLGGLLKDGKKIGISSGLIVGTLLIGVYGESEQFLPSVYASSLAIALFLLIPTQFFHQLSRYIPGTDVYEEEQEKYLKKVRNITAKRVEQFSNVFAALSNSFIAPEEADQRKERKEKETDYFLSEVTEQTCQHCFMKERCWQRQFDKTYSLLSLLKDELSVGDLTYKTNRDFENYCVKSRKVIQVMKDELSVFDANQKLKKQVKDSKRLVADQLLGVSQVMDDFSKEILKEKKLYDEQEEEIYAGLSELGIQIDKIDIFQLEKGNVDLEIVASFYHYHGEGEKVVAPFLSDVLEELIVVKEEAISPFPNGYSYLSFHSAKKFVVDTGIAHAAKGGGFISGDSYTEMKLGVGKHVLAISDGMGNGKRAKDESEETLRLLQQILKTGIPEQVAIKSINSILALRTTDDMYATLDVTVMNLHSATIRCLKIGSSPSFIKRGKELFEIKASNLPIGIIHDFRMETIQEQLKSGDLLIMMSDGIYDGPQVMDKRSWFQEKLNELETSDIQHVADFLLEEVIRENEGHIFDDMTVIVAKIERNKPKWSSIPVHLADA